MRYGLMDSPVGRLLIVSDGRAICRLDFVDEQEGPQVEAAWVEDYGGVVGRAIDQLNEYFDGRREAFDLPLSAEGTEFQREAWEQLRRIPFGRTISYGEQARRMGRDGAARAVGAANGRNPIAIVVPCHRVIGSNGSLTGFGGGMSKKKQLLEMERAHATAVAS